MDYKERYEKALAIACKLYNEAKANGYTSDMEDYESIFPELRESEDERIRKWIIKQIKTYDPSNIKDKALAYLEKQGEQKPAWSEEDERMIRALVSMCDVWATSHQFYPKENKEMEALKTWLYSLKERYTWRPSEVQIEALAIAIRCGIKLGTWEEEALKDLIEQLKRLREE